MQKINLLTYSDDNYSELQKKLSENAILSNAFNSVTSKTSADLKKTEFYNKHQNILDQKRGAGYWLWKPFFILQQLCAMNINDILVYVDCGDQLHELDSLRSFLLNKMENLDVLLTKGAFKTSDYTKRDCFVLMGCDNKAYWDEIQMEAGILVFKNTQQSNEILRKWIEYASNLNILTDEPNICGLPNIEGFKDHRHDQSILTNLSIIYNLHSSHEMRQFVTCNKNSIE